MPRGASAGDVAVKSPLSEESTLVKLYQTITQENESQARNVLMFVVRDDEEAHERLGTVRETKGKTLEEM